MNEEKPHRHEKISELVKREVGKTRSQEISFEEELVTVSQVVVSPNHQHATVMITVLPYDKSEEALARIEENIIAIQQTLNKALRMRPVPKLKFKIDPSKEKASQTLDILNQN